MSMHLQTDAVSVACHQPEMPPPDGLSTAIAEVTCPDCREELAAAESLIVEQASAGWRHGLVVRASEEEQ